MATERQILGQAQRILVDATNQIWHKISLWTHVSDVEMNDGTPLNEFLTDMNEDLSDRIDGKYNSYNIATTNIANLSQIPEVGYSRVATTVDITAGDYTIPANHYCYCYSGKDPNSIEKMAVMIDTTDLSSIIMYIAHYSIEARWTLTKIATQKQIDNLQDQINNLSNEFNRLNMFVESSVGNLNARYNIIQNQMDWLEAELAELQEFLNDLLNELRDFKREVDGKFGEIDKMFKALYGNLGSIYLTTNPDIHFYETLERLFGGKWVMIQNAYLYAAAFGIVREGQTDDEILHIPWGQDSFSIDRAAANNMQQSPTNDMVDRLFRDYSAIFRGRENFVLDKSNLPEHRHRVNDAEYNRGNMVSYELKRSREETPANAFADVFLPDSVGEHQSGYFTVAANKAHFTNVGRPGYGIIEPITGPNEFPNEPISQPVNLNPTRFNVFVWCRVA